MPTVKRPWTNKKEPTNPDKKEQHKNNKTKHELVHLWQEDDWEIQVKEYNGTTSRMGSK